MVRLSRCLLGAAGVFVLGSAPVRVALAAPGVPPNPPDARPVDAPTSVPAPASPPASPPAESPAPLLRAKRPPSPPPAPPPTPPVVEGPAVAPVHHAEPKAWSPDPHQAPKPDEFYREVFEPYNPTLRQNIFDQKISHEWDAERIINSDRPDFTDVLPTVGKYTWQTESGITFRHRVGSDYKLNRVSVPETTIRLGLTDRFELRVKFDAFAFGQRQGSAAEGTGNKSAYGADLLVGFKWQAVPQAGWIPGHTFLGTVLARMGNGGPAQTLIQPGVNWVYGWQINKWLVLRGSTGLDILKVQPYGRGVPEVTPTEKPEDRAIFEVHQSVVTYMQLVKRVGMYLEWFSFYGYGSERYHQHNGGVGYYIYLTPNIQLDIRGGGTIVGSVSESFVGGGISFRGKYRYKKRS